MSAIKNIGEIESIKVHWSESNVINDKLGCDDNCDIEKWVEPNELNDLIIQAVEAIDCGYDKTSMTVKLTNGKVWANADKFHIGRSDKTLLDVLNK